MRTNSTRSTWVACSSSGQVRPRRAAERGGQQPADHAVADQHAEDRPDRGAGHRRRDRVADDDPDQATADLAGSGDDVERGEPAEPLGALQDPELHAGDRQRREHQRQAPDGPAGGQVQQLGEHRRRGQGQPGHRDGAAEGEPVEARRLGAERPAAPGEHPRRHGLQAQGGHVADEHDPEQRAEGTEPGGTQQPRGHQVQGVAEEVGHRHPDGDPRRARPAGRDRPGGGRPSTGRSTASGEVSSMGRGRTRGIRDTIALTGSATVGSRRVADCAPVATSLSRRAGVLAALAGLVLVPSLAGCSGDERGRRLPAARAVDPGRRPDEEL